MENSEQKYATKKFFSLESAESFKKKVGSNFNITEHFNERGKHLPKAYHVRFKIDKTKSKKQKVYAESYDNFERFWKD